MKFKRPRPLLRRVVGWEHAKLDVYREARQIARELDLIARAVGRVRPDLRDQLHRASASIALNIAEGAGEFRPAEKVRFYRIARRSAAECAAILDLIDDLGTTPDKRDRERNALYDISAGLSRLVRSFEEGRP